MTKKNIELLFPNAYTHDTPLTTNQQVINEIIVKSPTHGYRNLPKS